MPNAETKRLSNKEKARIKYSKEHKWLVNGAAFLIGVLQLGITIQIYFWIANVLN